MVDSPIMSGAIKFENGIAGASSEIDFNRSRHQENPGNRMLGKSTRIKCSDRSPRLFSNSRLAVGMSLGSASVTRHDAATVRVGIRPEQR